VEHNVTIRPTTTTDRPSVLHLFRAAFALMPGAGSEEIAIVNAIWERSDAATVDLVALVNGSVVGHVLASPGILGGTEIPGIAPLCVAPELQRRGIGAALMTEVLDALRTGGDPFAVLLGRPAYYARFEFTPAHLYGLSYAPVGEGHPGFQVLRLQRDAEVPSGAYVYSWER
jgi:predicted N-acetyltransferase YhbS